jgi:rare lipoprotein A
MRASLFILLIAGSVLAASCSSLHESMDAVYANVTPLESDEGIASYYSDKFQGRKTASGERYDRNGLTAAHRSYPFGTLLRVRSTQSGETVIVRVNDRGPSKRSRLLDLSYAAAAHIGMLRAGLARVTVDVVSWGPASEDRAADRPNRRGAETADDTKHHPR